MVSVNIVGVSTEGAGVVSLNIVGVSPGVVKLSLNLVVGLLGKVGSEEERFRLGFCLKKPGSPNVGSLKFLFM